MHRILFEKTGRAIWMSHLDLMRLMQRAFRRAGVVLHHSQGFSPVSLGRCLAAVFPESANRIECGEMLIPEADGSKHLPAGMFARFFAE